MTAGKKIEGILLETANGFGKMGYVIPVPAAESTRV